MIRTLQSCRSRPTRRLSARNQQDNIGLYLLQFVRFFYIFLLISIMKKVRIITKVNMFAALSLCIVAAGCSNMDFGRSPASRIGDAFDPGKPFVAEGEDPQAIEEARRERLEQVLAEWVKQSGVDDEDYRIGPEDILRIDILSLERANETASLKRTVENDGSISLPWVGRVNVGGLIPREAEQLVRDAYDTRFLRNPQISVTVDQHRSHAVVMTGAVAKPGVYFLKRSSASILEIISMAGGLAAAAGNELLILRAAETPAVTEDADDVDAAEDQEPASHDAVMVDLRRLVEDGDIRLNVSVRAGDVISVPSRRRAFIYVLGYVQGPGAREFDPKQGITALNALAMSGGLSPQGRADNVFIVRETQDGGRRVIPIDLAKIAHGVRPDLPMHAGDTMVVGSSVLMKMTEFIRPTVSTGMSYTPAP